MNGLLEMMKSAMIETEGKGQDDDVPIMASEGEYVVPANIVSLLGQGNTQAGAKVLDTFLKQLSEMLSQSEE